MFEMEQQQENRLFQDASSKQKRLQAEQKRLQAEQKGIDEFYERQKKEDEEREKFLNETPFAIRHKKFTESGGRMIPYDWYYKPEEQKVVCVVNSVNGVYRQLEYLSDKLKRDGVDQYDITDAIKPLDKLKQDYEAKLNKLLEES